ncbi:MAG: tRNA uridine-5-carboxymethylaminomethyl(34) synthesis GTPase MnmE [Bradyrhizobiaceae bacterium]|nr:tRNA uridine-5-carboxymethylaminomethyl(34) synthesis GTPase MnmE [Bradyrhizobiaceae bacterium]
MPDAADTIFALSSGRPPAAIGVVRISGPRASAALESLIGRVPPARRATFARVREPSTGETIDEAVVLWFPGPRSETGEDTAEVQLHGGRAVIAAVLAALARVPGLRLAEAGEFTRRAFENGRLDLTRVEGLADLIYADTEVQRRQAYRQLQGLLGNRAEHWRETLIESIALVEAGIDFSDESDVPANTLDPALAAAQQLHREIEDALTDSHRGERLREGLVVAIAGPVNVGKSSLLNRIARRDAAIVSPLAGTTRDVIEVHLDLDGYPVTMLDTAGIRPSDDPIEQEGVRRALERASAADLVLWVVDLSAPRGAALDEAALQFPETLKLVVYNKVDLGVAAKPDQVLRLCDQSVSISAKTGEGLNELLQKLAEHARSHFGSAEPALVTRQRQRHALEAAASALGRAIAEGKNRREDIVAEELRLAARSLGRLTGRVDVEDVLDVIFRDFCVGK